MKNNKTIFTGRSTVDHTYLLEEFPAENTKVFSREYLFQCGGPALNAAITNTNLGGSSKLISCFGNSQTAMQAKESLSRNYSIEIHDISEGMDYEFPVSAILINPKTGSRTIINTPKTTDSLEPDYSNIRFSDCSVIMLDGYNLHHSLRDKIIEARSKGTKTVMDGGSWKPDSGDYLDLIDYIVCSTKFIKPGHSQKETIKHLHNAGIDFVAFTDNENPIRVSESGIEKHIPVEQINAVDTLGAGDVLHGAFCHYLSLGMDGLTALENASKIATDSCRYFGTNHWSRDL